jgi:pseudouridine-5'-phosphate glycosidase
MYTAPPLDIHPDVRVALETARPVVALVTAPLAHTLPWPSNLETYRRIDDAVREEGGTLAAIGVWQGRLTAGLDAGHMETLARGANVLRASRRDLPSAVVAGANAAATVSASMYIAKRAGIRLLATGAIGGAARETSDGGRVFNISADLIELMNTPVAVVSAGARSVHNLAFTAEMLETLRVPVIGYGTATFPTFYIRAGTYPVPARADTPAQVAALLSAHWGMDGAGMVIAQPTPADAALSPDELFPALQAVEHQAAHDRVDRKDLSPFLMDRLNRLTRGKALRAYEAVLVANARLAVQIAAALASA